MSASDVAILMILVAAVGAVLIDLRSAIEAAGERIADAVRQRGPEPARRETPAAPVATGASLAVFAVMVRLVGSCPHGKRRDIAMAALRRWCANAGVEYSDALRAAEACVESSDAVFREVHAAMGREIARAGIGPVEAVAERAAVDDAAPGPDGCAW
jgi:rhodanese-related sulfurtransferase